MKVWLVQHGYRLDGEVQGVYATKVLADAERERQLEMIGQRDNPSWAVKVIEMDVIGATERHSSTLEKQ